jgi:hypothetical protein
MYSVDTTALYSWNIAKVGIKHQSITQCDSVDTMVSVWWLLIKVEFLTQISSSLRLILYLYQFPKGERVCRDCDRMVVGFTTTYAVSAYHHWCCEFESRSGRGVHYVSDLWQVGGSLRVLWFPPPIKLTTTL